MPHSVTQSGVMPHLPDYLLLALKDPEFLESTLVRRSIHAGILDQRAQGSQRKVQSELIVEYLQSGQQPEGLCVAVELQKVARDVLAGTSVPKPLLNRDFSLMAKGWIAQVVRQANRSQHRRNVPLDLQCFMARAEHRVGVLEGQSDTDAAGQITHFVRMGQPGSHGIIGFHGKDLSLVRQTSRRGCEKNAVVVPLAFRSTTLRACRFLSAVQVFTTNVIQQLFPSKHGPSLAWCGCARPAYLDRTGERSDPFFACF